MVQRHQNRCKMPIYCNSPILTIAQLVLVNTYVLDPSHIAPSRSDANSNGHFPMNNHNLAAGTPRGFNLSNITMMTGFPAGFPQQPFPMPQFGNHTVQAPGGWPMNSAMAANGDETHQTGPMRRGGGRFNNRQGPYDRRQQPRFNDGRLTPMVNGNPMMNRRGGFGGAGKWGDGGAQTVGPREAVVGRTIKKYDDLDAVEGGGAGELNY